MSLRRQGRLPATDSDVRCGYYRYPTHKSAKREAAKRNTDAAPHQRWRVYRCEKCDEIHLEQPQGMKNRRRRARDVIKARKRSRKQRHDPT